MSTALLTFKPSKATTVTEYDVTFSVNGTSAPVVKVTTLTPDASGNLSATLGSTLTPGDTVGASVVAVDTVHGLTSAPAVATPVTVPVAPPDAPVIVSLTVV